MFTRQPFCRVVAILLFTSLLGLSPSLLADEAGKLSMQDIGKLRLQRKTHAQILELIKERGVSFEVDKNNAAALRTMGFKPADIETITSIADGTYADKLKKQEEEAARLEAEKPQPPKPGTAPADVTVGPRLSNSAHDTIAARAVRIHVASNTNTKLFPTETVTLIASEKTSKIHLPNLQKLEADLRKRFGEPTKTGTDKRSAHIVLLDTRYEYEAWVKAMFAIYEKDGMRWTNGDALNIALKGPVFLTPTMTVADLSALTPEQQVHQSVFCFGYLYSAQLMEGKSPDAATNGFGNVCEVIIFGHPTIRVLSASSGTRELNGGAGQWQQVVRERAKTGKLTSIDKVLRFTTESMEADEYCEAWSLTEFLASTPDLYNRWIQAIREKEKPLAAMIRVYGKSEAEMYKAWQRFIQK